MKSNTKAQNLILNTEEVAELFNVSAATVREWAKKGILKGDKVGKQWFFGSGYIWDLQATKDGLDTLGENAERSGIQPYDILIKEKNLNVRVELKSSNLRETKKGKYWRFSMLHKTDLADYYLLVGYNENRKKLLRVYFISAKELVNYYKTVCRPTNKNKFEFKGISIYTDDKFMKGFIVRDISS